MRTLLVVLLLVPALVFGQNRDRAQALLESSLKDKNPDTRKHAVQALGLASPNEPWLSELDSMLEDKDVEVQLAAVTSLVDLRNKRTVPALRKALDGNVPEVRFAAAKALWTLNDPAGREALVSVLSGETKTSSGLIARQKRDAIRMLHTPRTMFIFALKQGASMAPVPGLGAGVSSLQGILSDPGVSGRAATALLLSADRSPEVLQALREALTDSDWSVRAAAVHALALRNDPALESDLLPLLDDRKEAVRVRAAAAFLRLESIKAGKRMPAPASKDSKK
ncbi:MAG: HEAT repeat domain-containing protein [Acidobacteriota bacterium]|nr:HEAT repeat domain-containing protein [Acidobacteriota bacterium]